MTNNPPDAAPRTALGLAMLAAAALLGILGDLLFHDANLGINVPLWVALLLAAGIWVWRRRAEGGRLAAAPPGRTAVKLALAGLFFAACFAWRASPPLQILDALAFLVLMGLAVLDPSAGQLRTAGIGDFVVGIATAAGRVAFGPIWLIYRDVSWEAEPRRRWPSTAMAVLRGLLIAIPLVVVFGALFVAADVVFGRLVSDFFNLPIQNVLEQLVLGAFFAWMAAGTLHAAFLGRGNRPRPAWGGSSSESSSSRSAFASQPLALGRVEAATVLVALDALFAAFLAVQFRALFGGYRYLEATAGLTYAEYARQGFFVLLAVAVLALVVLLVGHWLLRADARDSRAFRRPAGLLLALVFVVLGSAVFRLWMYEQAFGLTLQRFFGFACMVWLAFVLVWFAVTVLRGRRERFAWGALASALVLLAALHVANPEALVVRANVAKFVATGRFDADYARTLSADAAPALVGAILQRAPAGAAAGGTEGGAAGGGTAGGGTAGGAGGGTAGGTAEGGWLLPADVRRELAWSLLWRFHGPAGAADSGRLVEANPDPGRLGVVRAWGAADRDLRAWNWSRARAWQAVDGHVALWQAVGR